MTPQAGLFLSAIAFVGLHFLLSHPLARHASVRKLGERGVPGRLLRSSRSLTFGLMIYFYGRIGREPPIWTLRRVGLGHCRARDVDRRDPLRRAPSWATRPCPAPVWSEARPPAASSRSLATR